MNIKSYLEQEKCKLERAIAEDQAYINNAPVGSLIAKPVGKNFAWVRMNGDNANRGNNPKNGNNANSGDNPKNGNNPKNGDNANKKGTYIKKKDRKLAETLAAKAYVEARLDDEITDLKATNLYLSHCAISSKAEKYQKKNDEYQRLLKPYLVQHDEDIETWLSELYTGPRPHPEELTKLTRAGYYVRSKSEQMIVAHFVKYGVPHKYEQRLFVNGHDLYPDFMVMNPRTHKVYIWEHFGKMDDYNYRARNAGKVDDYASIGYLLGDNLIFTFETKKSGLDEIFVEKIIEHYLT